MNLAQTFRDYLELASGFFARYRLAVISGLAVLILGLGGWFGYSIWLGRKEQELGKQVNRLTIELMNIAQVAEASLEAQDRITAIYAELERLGRANQGTQNGLRALFLSANGDFQSARFPQARDKYLALNRKDGRHYLAGQALFYAALTHEEEGQLDKCIELLREFERRYPSHWLYGEVELSLARNLAATGKVDLAYALYEKLGADSKLEAYHGRAADQKKVLALRGYAPKAPTVAPPILPKLPGQ